MSDAHVAVVAALREYHNANRLHHDEDARLFDLSESALALEDVANSCALCGDVTAAMFLHARCHPSAPLRARKEGNMLILSCYLPACGREVARLTLEATP